MSANPLLVPAELARLLEACRTTLLTCTHPSVKVAAAVSDSEGAVHIGVQVRSTNCGHCATCAEPVAIGAALAAGAATLVACVAMVRDHPRPRVWSPCGTCREMLRDFGVHIVVVAQTPNGHPIIASPDDLLPWP
jgi:cytidine deaminase